MPRNRSSHGYICAIQDGRGTPSPSKGNATHIGQQQHTSLSDLSGRCLIGAFLDIWIILRGKSTFAILFDSKLTSFLIRRWLKSLHNAASVCYVFRLLGGKEEEVVRANKEAAFYAFKKTLLFKANGSLKYAPPSQDIYDQFEYTWGEFEEVLDGVAFGGVSGKDIAHLPVYEVGQRGV